MHVHCRRLFDTRRSLTSLEGGMKNAMGFEVKRLKRKLNYVVKALNSLCYCLS